MTSDIVAYSTNYLSIPTPAERLTIDSILTAKLIGLHEHVQKIHVLDGTALAYKVWDDVWEDKTVLGFKSKPTNILNYRKENWWKLVKGFGNEPPLHNDEQVHYALDESMNFYMIITRSDTVSRVTKENPLL